METGRALDAARGAGDKNGRDSHDGVLSKRAVQVSGAAEPAIPAAFHLCRNLNLTDKQVNHMKLKTI
jgi:hypothetical protein